MEMQVLFTTLDGRSNFLQAQKEIVSKSSQELLLVAHRIDETYFRLLSDELSLLAAKRVPFRLLVSSTHLSNAASALILLKEIYPTVECRVSDCVHAKALIGDRKRIVIGSANAAGDGLGVGSEWTRQDHPWDQPNFEIGVMFSDERIVQEIAELIFSHWSVAQPLQIPVDALISKGPD